MSTHSNPPLATPRAGFVPGTLQHAAITIDGVLADAVPGELLIDALNRAGKALPQVCYHPHLGPIQTCDTCMVEIGDKLVRACGQTVRPGLTVTTESGRATKVLRNSSNRPFRSDC